MTAYGTLTDYTTGQPLRPATREGWEMTARSIDEGHPEGVWRDDDTHPSAVYVDGGPDPIVSDQAVRDFGDESEHARDLDQEYACQQALAGDEGARAQCVALIRDYRCREAEALG